MHVAGLFRYPVKSMAGESLHHVRLSAAGLRGDRVRALRDPQTGAIVSGKHPQRWRAV